MFLKYDTNNKIIGEENSCNKNNDTNEGLRDILLIKCKTAIEELHLEIDDTN